MADERIFYGGGDSPWLQPLCPRSLLFVMPAKAGISLYSRKPPARPVSSKEPFGVESSEKKKSFDYN